MSHFSSTLSRLLESRTQAKVAEASGISRSGIAQYATGTNGISVSALTSLLHAFPEHQDKVDLVIAHLRDETPASMFDAIRIEACVKRARNEPPPPIWAKDLDIAIELLRTRARSDASIRKLILDLGEIV